MGATIRDVAKLAGVSITTVSRVINHVDNVNAQTVQVVHEAITKLNFKPNRIAQSLGSGGFNAICVVSTRSAQQAFNNPYFSMMLQSIGEVAEQKNHDIILVSSQNEATEIEKCVSMIRGKVIQGLILLSSRNNDRLIEKLYELKTPFVVVGRVPDERLSSEVYSVDTDSFEDCREAVRYLIDLGHRRIACLHAPLKYVVSRDRLDGYVAAHKDCGLPVDYSLIAEGGYSIGDAHAAAMSLFQEDRRPTAIFATDDVKAMGAYRAISDLQLRIPEDISLFGHNNYEYTSIMKPELSTIDVPINRLGSLSATVLFNLIENLAPPHRTILETKMVLRHSCQPPPLI